MANGNNITMTLRPDCRHFPGDRPCRFNKEHGQICADCSHYATHGHRILIIKLAAQGDVLRTTAILPGIKEEFPHSYIVWLTLAAARELLRENPFIDEIWTVEEDVAGRLMIEEFDLALSPDADKRAAGLAALARAETRRGMVLDRRGYVIPANTEAVTWLEMGAFDQFKKQNGKTYQELIFDMLKLPYRRQELILVLQEAERQWAARFLAAQQWRAGEKIVGLNAGGGGRWKKKRWKEQQFEAFVRRVLEETNTKVLLIGGALEMELLQRLQAALPAGVLCSGPNRSLRETAALIGCCRALVTGDTLCFHLATALKVPTVVMLGPTSAAELDTYQRGQKVIAPIGCVGCYLTDCAVAPDCMDLIKPEQVWELVRPYLCD
jgi:heptosyltransferase-2